MQQNFIIWLAKIIAPLIIKWRGNLYHFERAIREAERTSYRHNGKRHYVYFIGGRYRVLNRKQIQHWRNVTKGVRVDLSVSRMKNIQLYDTMGHVNSHPFYTQVNPRIKADIVYKQANNTK